MCNRAVFSFFFLILSLFVLPGCNNRQRDGVTLVDESTKFELFLAAPEVPRIEKKEAEDAGIIFLPSAEYIACFQEGALTVANYVIEMPFSKKHREPAIKKNAEGLIATLRSLYINEGWSVSDTLPSESFVSFSGEKPSATLYVTEMILFRSAVAEIVIHTAVTKK